MAKHSPYYYRHSRKKGQRRVTSTLDQERMPGSDSAACVLPAKNGNVIYADGPSRPPGWLNDGSGSGPRRGGCAFNGWGQFSVSLRASGHNCTVQCCILPTTRHSNVIGELSNKTGRLANSSDSLIGVRGIIRGGSVATVWMALVGSSRQGRCTFLQTPSPAQVAYGQNCTIRL